MFVCEGLVTSFRCLSPNWKRKSTLTQPLTDLVPPSLPPWGLGDGDVLVMSSAVGFCNEGNSEVLNDRPVLLGTTDIRRVSRAAPSH